VIRVGEEVSPRGLSQLDQGGIFRFNVLMKGARDGASGAGSACTLFCRSKLWVRGSASLGLAPIDVVRGDVPGLGQVW